MWNTRKAHSYVHNIQIVFVSLLHFDQATHHLGFRMLQTGLLNYILNKYVCILRLSQLQFKTFMKCVSISINFFVQKGV
jgi:hypothetical protein